MEKQFLNRLEGCKLAKIDESGENTAVYLQDEKGTIYAIHIAGKCFHTDVMERGNYYD
jgi:hypothetical protein